MILRKACKADLPHITAIEKAWSHAPWQDNALLPALMQPYHFYVIEQDHQAVAYGIVQIALNEANILTLGVAEPYRKRGFGRQVLQALMDVAKTEQCESVFLEVAENNLPAIKLYQRFGFEKVGMRKGYYQTSQGAVDAQVMKYVI